MRSKIISYMLFCLALIINPFAQADTLFVVPKFAVPNPFASNPQPYRLAAFNTISVHGPATLHIVTTNAPPQLVATPTARALLHPWVFNGVLYLSTRYPTSPVTIAINPYLPFNLSIDGPASITINGCDNINLQHLEINGPANLVVNGLSSNLLSIEDNGGQNVMLRGMAILDTLCFRSDGSLSLHWVNSSHARIQAYGHGQINLAGVTGRLDASMHDCTTLNAKYLRAQQGFIETNAYSRADVWVRDSLASWAKDESNIYYYKHPELDASYMEPPAVSLSVAGIAP